MSRHGFFVADVGEGSCSAATRPCPRPRPPRSRRPVGGWAGPARSGHEHQRAADVGWTKVKAGKHRAGGRGRETAWFHQVAGTAPSAAPSPTTDPQSSRRGPTSWSCGRRGRRTVRGRIRGADRSRQRLVAAMAGAQAEPEQIGRAGRAGKLGPATRQGGAGGVEAFQVGRRWVSAARRKPTAEAAGRRYVVGGQDLPAETPPGSARMKSPGER